MPDASSREELTRKAGFIFRGTVQRINAASLREISDTSNTAVVRVDRTLQASEALSHYDGQDITVHLADLAGIKAGDRASSSQTHGYLGMMA